MPSYVINLYPQLQCYFISWLTPGIFRLLRFANAMDQRWYVLVVVICISLITSELEHHDRYLLAIHMSSPENLDPFFYWCVFFFSLTYRCQYFRFSLFLGIFITNMFSQLQLVLSFCLSIHPSQEDKFIIIVVKFTRLFLNVCGFFFQSCLKNTF